MTLLFKRTPRQTQYKLSLQNLHSLAVSLSNGGSDKEEKFHNMNFSKFKEHNSILFPPSRLTMETLPDQRLRILISRLKICPDILSDTYPRDLLRAERRLSHKRDKSGYALQMQAQSNIQGNQALQYRSTHYGAGYLQFCM